MDPDVAAYLDAVPSPQRRRDALALAELVGRVTGEQPRMWGKIVGFGEYHYKYESGREGDTARVGFAARKAATTIYLCGGVAMQEDLLETLGPHSTGVGCLYIKDLDQVDRAVLEAVVARAYTSPPTEST